ncbi:hypothetical protein SAMN05421749_105112 [Acinetobacter marinus]|uniref:Uncharacterized protein n=1 Tax=Acinetobacter marinus TaxID=281375 RepID=A0A1G6LM53_9GAMM|nr:hypothetical protein [Acinetobacter marinus]SDC44249.1 hypothetical protein SAMN05421749_105112 [Acinetobacter marinus]
MSKKDKESILKISENHQTIYCDHLFRFALGPIVSKLDFGMLIERGDSEEPEITTTLIVPTPHLLDALPLILQQSQNPEIKGELAAKLKQLLKSYE